LLERPFSRAWRRFRMARLGLVALQRRWRREAIENYVGEAARGLSGHVLDYAVQANQPNRDRQEPERDPKGV
jgi:hypothetical protein